MTRLSGNALGHYLANIFRVSLKRAQTSELSLANEGDILEYLVNERTKELYENQILRNIELEKFAEFGRLSANLLHEIANPLTAASLNLDLFEGKEHQLLMSVRRNLNQLERYINAARKQLKDHGDKSNFSLRNEMANIALVLKPLARAKNINLIFNIEGNIYIYGDSVKLNQLISNLIVNSIDAYDEIVSDKKNIEVNLNMLGSNILIEVKDWGIGIESNEIPLLFQPFYSTKSSSNRGTGIGLTMVKHIVEDEYGGRIKVRSTPNKGTSFKVYLKTKL